MATRDPATSFLTQTNSLGVVTGLPTIGTASEETQPAAITSQPDTEITTSSQPPTTTSVHTPTLEASGEASSTVNTPTIDGNSGPSPTDQSTGLPNTPSTTSTSTSTFAPDSGNKSSINIGAIVGGAIGGLVVIGIVVIALYWIRRRHPKTPKKPSHPEAQDVPSKYKDTALPEVAYGQHNAPGFGTQELDGRWNQINELPAERK